MLDNVLQLAKTINLCLVGIVIIVIQLAQLVMVLMLLIVIIVLVEKYYLMVYVIVIAQQDIIDMKLILVNFVIHLVKLAMEDKVIIAYNAIVEAP